MFPYDRSTFGVKGARCTVLTADTTTGKTPCSATNVAANCPAFALPATGRMTPADAGHAVAMVCMDEAGFITGQTIHVDGGASIMDTAFPRAIQGF